MPWSSEPKYLHSYIHVINYLPEDKKIKRKKKSRNKPTKNVHDRIKKSV